jgi:hypothetical protein
VYGYHELNRFRIVQSMPPNGSRIGSSRLDRQISCTKQRLPELSDEEIKELVKGFARWRLNMVYQTRTRRRTCWHSFKRLF